jgi:superfamily I DNA and/or RNA helicase
VEVVEGVIFGPFVTKLAAMLIIGLFLSVFIVSGDFRQLSPIVPTEQGAVQDMIGSDVFQAAGITEAMRAQKSLKRTIMLTDQYRMNPSICRMISGRMYEGRLKTQTQSRIGMPSPPPPFDGPLTVIDTSPIKPFVNKHGSSRYNLMNALAVRNLFQAFSRNRFLRRVG